MENKQIVGDYLNRQNFISTIYQYIINNVNTNSKAICFGIDGEWGQGKTWIIDKIEKKLRGGDLFIEEEKDEYNIEEYFVFKYNAWELDYYEDPLIAILVTLVDQLNKIDIVRLDKALKNAIKSSLNILVRICGILSKKMLGVNVVESVVEIGKKVKDFNELSKMKLKTSKNSITEDIDNLLMVLNHLSSIKPIIFLVDEIDRCLPEYAIKTLERLHHIFGKVKGSVTIIATDKKQLTKSIETIYGCEYDVEKYLQKFIMFCFKLDNGLIDQSNLENKMLELENKIGNGKLENYEFEFLKNILNDLNVREKTMIFDRTLICLNTIANFKNEFSDSILLIGCIFISVLNYYINTKRGYLNLENLSPFNIENSISPIENYLKEYFKQYVVYNGYVTFENKMCLILLSVIDECICNIDNYYDFKREINRISNKTKEEIKKKIKSLIDYYSVSVLLM